MFATIHAILQFHISLSLLSPLSCHWTLCIWASSNAMVSKTGKPQEFLFLLKQEQMQLSKSEITADWFFSIIDEELDDKSSPTTASIHSSCVMRQTRSFFPYKMKVYNPDKPIASTISVYDAWASLSSPTTVRTTPSLKPTLNLPSWLPPENKEHKRISKSSYSVLITHIRSHRHGTDACKRSSPQTHRDGWMDKCIACAHSNHNCTTL